MTGKRRRVSNPLALAVLSTLRERPMHPYEMAATMRAQGKERSIKLNYGSLYTVVDNLAKHGLIEAMEASRAGRRPERTVYRLTDEGRTELEDWLTDLLGTPVKEYPQFEAALAEMAVLPPAQVRDVLERRVEALEKALAQERAEIAQLTWLPRLFLLENEYHLALQEAELALGARPGAGTPGGLIPPDEGVGPLDPDRGIPGRPGRRALRGGGPGRDRGGKRRGGGHPRAPPAPGTDPETGSGGEGSR